MNNIDKFDVLTGKILARLYGDFPLKSYFLGEDFGFANNVFDASDKAAKELEFFDACVEWLAENELITAKREGLGRFSDVRLTFKGLRLLKAAPKSIEGRGKSFGEWIREYAKSGGEELLRRAVGGLFDYGADVMKAFA